MALLESQGIKYWRSPIPDLAADVMTGAVARTTSGTVHAKVHGRWVQFATMLNGPGADHRTSVRPHLLQLPAVPHRLPYQGEPIPSHRRWQPMSRPYPLLSRIDPPGNTVPLLVIE